MYSWLNIMQFWTYIFINVKWAHRMCSLRCTNWNNLLRPGSRYWICQVIHLLRAKDKPALLGNHTQAFRVNNSKQPKGPGVSAWGLHYRVESFIYYWFILFVPLFKNIENSGSFAWDDTCINTFAASHVVKAEACAVKPSAAAAAARAENVSGSPVSNIAQISFN